MVIEEDQVIEKIGTMITKEEGIMTMITKEKGGKKVLNTEEILDPDPDLMGMKERGEEIGIEIEIETITEEGVKVLIFRQSL